MSTAPNTPFLPSGLSQRERKQQKQQELAQVEAWKNTPEQRRIAEHQAQPKVTPQQPTLRECIVANLSLAEMSIIDSQSGTLEYLDTVHKVAKFSLWPSYRRELKAMNVPQVQLNYMEATAKRGSGMRDTYRHLTCMYAIFHLVRDPSVRAEREARDIGAATDASQRANRPRRL